ncbi:MAG: restriction endonuclease [Kineosporiaceae bacterium]
MWGIHNDTLTTELVEQGFVSVGWDELGDLSRIPDHWDDLKRALAEAYPDRKPRGIAAWTGSMWRFRNDMQVGDIVVCPYKPDSTINIGVVTGDYRFEAGAETHRHRRDVRWVKVGLSRTVFTQPALYELGAFLTVFQIKKHAAEFRAALGTTETSEEDVTRVVETAAANEPAVDSVDEPRASRIDRHTRDFVLSALEKELNHREFEEFTADLLRALGYQARVTQYGQDGGVDVIAHRDPLGVEPPLIKVQCKHHTSTIGAPEVQQLIGTQQGHELAVFVTLGKYSVPALAIERQRSSLRLLSGEDVVGLVLDNYEALPQKWRSRIPLTRLLVVDDAADA